MNLNELITIWHSSDQELDRNLKINKRLFMEVSVNKIRSLLSEFKWGNIIEIGVDALFLIFLLGFFIDNLLMLKYAVPAAILILIMIYGLGFNIYMLRLFYQIDVRSSIVQTQKIVERLKYYKLFDTKMLYVIIPLFSAPLLIVMAKAVFNVDLYVLGQWLIFYTAGSFIVALIVVFFLRKFPGEKMQKAISFLKEIKDFENQGRIEVIDE